MEQSTNHTSRSSKAARVKRNRIVIAAALSACVVLGAATGGMVVRQRQKEAEEAAEARRQAVAVAAMAAAQEEELFTELAAEGRELSSINASDLSKTFHAQWEERRKNTTSGSGTGYTWTSPATGVFNASAYGYSGADKIAYWSSVNSDVVGWLKVPGTNIDWPIVQNTQDVNYYTHLGYDKQYSYNGVIWTNPSTRTSASESGLSSNTVLYGHNWTNYSASPRVGYPGDVMFGQLTGFHWLSMAQSYPYFYYSTVQGGEFVVKLFACFYTEEAFNYIASEGDMSYIISEAQRRSRHSFDVDVNASDKIVTLSTCTRAYGATSNQRFVVMGRLLRPGESIGPVTVTANPGHKQPNVW